MAKQEFIESTLQELIINVGIVAINANGIVIFFNEMAAIILNYPQEKAIGKNIHQITPDTGLIEVLESGQPEFNRIQEAGNCVIVSNRFAITYDGKIVGAVSTFEDIGKMKELSKQLETAKELNKELDALIEFLDDGIVVSDGQGVILRINNAYQRIVGLTSKEEYVGKHVTALLNEGYINRCLSPMVIERKSQVTIVDIRNNKELLITGNPVFNDKGELIRVVSAVRDVTQLKQLQEKLAESEEINNKYHQELEHLRSEKPFQMIVTQNPAMKKKIDLAFHVAHVDSTVLITGESGVGKGLLVSLIHRASKRARQPLLTIDCGALPANLLEAELFGYEPGAFTGAHKDGKHGLFELAQLGTLFLDEIGEIPMELQVKLLRSIQEKEIMRIGGQKNIGLDVRIIAATNRNLEEMVKGKLFRQDLYYRLNVVPIFLPPLRERKEDILLLVNEFLNKLNKRYGFHKWIDPEVMSRFLTYEWPGNIRELENMVERLVVTCQDDCITLQDLAVFHPIDGQLPRVSLSSLSEILGSEERRIIQDTYSKVKSTRKAAAILGISQSCMVKKLKKYGIS